MRRPQMDGQTLPCATRELNSFDSRLDLSNSFVLTYSTHPQTIAIFYIFATNNAPAWEDTEKSLACRMAGIA